MSIELSSITSPDGTKIAYYKLGEGPGLVIVHGAMQSGQSHMDLAMHLSTHFTCYLPDRRGRGQSGPLGGDYAPAKEVADLKSLVCETQAPFIFGVSSGAFITLQAAQASQTSSPQSSLVPKPDSSPLRRVAVFEPPWWPESERDATSAWVKRYESELRQGAFAEALATAMLGTKMGPPFLHSKFMPRWAVVSASKLLLSGDGIPHLGLHSAGSKPNPESPESSSLPPAPSFRMLAGTLHSDILIGQHMFGEEKLRTLAPFTLETLILNGALSPAYLHRSVRELRRVLPNAQRVELPNAQHTVTGNVSELGSPAIVAEELRRFFLR